MSRPILGQVASIQGTQFNIFHCPFVMARALDAGSGDAFNRRTSELRVEEIDPQPNRVGFKQDYPKTTPQQCSVAFKCVKNKSVKTTPQQCPVAFKCVNNKSVKTTPRQCPVAFKCINNKSVKATWQHLNNASY